MWPFLLGAVNWLLSFVLRGVVVKFLTFTAIFYITTEFISVLQTAGIFPSSAGMNSSLLSLPPAVWYFLDLFAVSQGLPMVLSALVSRFIVRRIPFIG